MKNIQRIYISGPITGVSGYMEHFAEAEKKITAAGYEAVNPAKTIAQLPKTLTWEECMQLCFAMLDICDGIYLMEGWKESKGAVAELKHAMEKVKAVVYGKGHCRKGISETEDYKMSKCFLGIEQPCEECRMCAAEEKQDKKMTNADWIRSLSNAELAKFLCKVKSDYQWADHEFPNEDAWEDWEEWLESECEEK